MSNRKANITRELVAAELKSAIGQLLRRLRAEANPGALNLSQTAVLSKLEQNGWMTTADLARAESMKPQSMGAILSRLERDGLVQHRPHPTDGRQVLFSLTAEGGAERRRRSTAKQEWLLVAMAKLDTAELRILSSAAALIKRLGDS
jgi:DNA-binding MarR family transcriptional regulator